MNSIELYKKAVADRLSNQLEIVNLLTPEQMKVAIQTAQEWDEQFDDVRGNSSPMCIAHGEDLEFVVMPHGDAEQYLYEASASYELRFLLP